MFFLLLLSTRNCFLIFVCPPFFMYSISGLKFVSFSFKKLHHHRVVVAAWWIDKHLFGTRKRAVRNARLANMRCWHMLIHFRLGSQLCLPDGAVLLTASSFIFFPLQVSWIRKKDYHLLTVGLTTYSSDERFSATHLKHSEVGSQLICIWASCRAALCCMPNGQHCVYVTEMRRNERLPLTLNKPKLQLCTQNNWLLFLICWLLLVFFCAGLDIANQICAATWRRRVRVSSVHTSAHIHISTLERSR